MALKLRTMDDVPLSGKRVLVRVDFNVTANERGVVGRNEDYRLESAMQTIQELREMRCRVLLLTHRGRPGEGDGDIDLAPVRSRLERLLGEPVRALPRLYGPEVETIVGSMEQGTVAMYPNVRLDDREEQISQKFGKDMGEHVDAFVSEAFSVCHRAHTSISVLPQILPSAAGRRTVKEVEVLTALREHPERPYVAITSGAKITTKIGMLRQLLRVVDTLCVGGQIANVFLAARKQWGNSMFSADELSAAQSILAEAGDRLLLPVDVMVGDALGTPESVKVVDVEDINEDVLGIWDIGPRSVQQIIDACAGAKTVMWNGPVGKFEVPAYAEATYTLAERLSHLDSYRVIGGGDTVNALEKLNLVGSYDHVSVGGGAMIAFLEGKRMPGLEPLYR